MTREDRQLEEMVRETAAGEEGETILFPEYGAYTVDGSRKAYEELGRAAANAGVTVITSLNLPSADLPGADPAANYNTLFIFSRDGEVYSPQAKITPQSFEMKHLDETSPRMNVAPYSRLNRVRLRQDSEEFDAFFFICSDLYALRLFGPEELKSEAILCPANFGAGAEGSAADVVDYAVRSGLFGQGFFCNAYQVPREDLPPLTIAAEKVFEGGEEREVYDREAMDEIVEKSSAVYPDEEYRNFRSMLELTRNGTFTVPRSRSAESGLKVQLGNYERVVEL